MNLENNYSRLRQKYDQKMNYEFSMKTSKTVNYSTYLVISHDGDLRGIH